MSAPVVCVGEILVDCLATVPGLPLGAVKTWVQLPGGAPANVSCALTKLGTAAAFVGAVGQDRWGRALGQLLNDIGVETWGLQTTARPTREVYVLLDRTGDRAFAGFSAQSPPGTFADAYLERSGLPQAPLMQARYLVTGTLGLAYPQSRAAIVQCMDWLHQVSGQVFMDVNWRPVFWPQPAAAPDIIRQVLPGVTFLKLAAEEADWLFDTVDPGAIARQLPQLKGVLVTAGAAGCRYWLQGHQGSVPGFAVDVEDTTGAGDAFVAGFLHQLYQQGRGSLHDPAVAHQMVRYACAVGALTTTRAGAIAAQPTPQEVDAFLFLHAG